MYHAPEPVFALRSLRSLGLRRGRCMISLNTMTQLILSDGTAFEGESFGADTDSDGEVVFNTGMAGYNESLTDPSYRGQILVFTYPLIGNYGVPPEELNEYGFSKNFESEDIHVRGVICTKVSEDFSHWNAEISFPDWLKKHGIPGITGVDTRALTAKLREKGVMLGRIVVDGGGPEFGIRDPELFEVEDPNLRNLVSEVSCKEVKTYEPRIPNSGARIPSIVAYDCGIKRNILRSFLKRGVKVVRVPWDFNLASADFKYDGVFISNGPGDPRHPEIKANTVKQVRWSIDQGIPTFGICLGNQILALAAGGDIFKLKYGHRGVNQPCVEYDKNSEKTDKCIITSQNHGFAVELDSLPKEWSIWFTNANDGTVEGIRHESEPFFSVQFHPEATPGPEDAGYLFDEFLGVVGKREKVVSY